MEQIVNQSNISRFKGRQFTAEIILQFPISYRELKRMLADRGVHVDQTTLLHWAEPVRRSSTTAFGGIYARPPGPGWCADPSLL